MKYLITSGCSFTSYARVNLQRGERDFLSDHIQFWYYPHWLQAIFPKIQVYNMGSPGNGNLLIARSAIYKAKQLLNNNVKGEDMAIIVEWSNFHRKSYFISNEIKFKAPIETHENYANDFINEKKYNGEKGYWITMTSPDMSTSSFVQLNPVIYDYTKKYLQTIYNDEERFIEWLEYFDYLINFCNLHKIQLKTFNMHNPFCNAYQYGMLPSNFKNGEEIIKALFIDKKVHNNWNDDDDEIIKRFPWAEHLYKGIDWKKYCWFFEEEGIHKNGGVLEWAVRNQVPSTDNDFNPLYQEYYQYESQTKTEQALIDGHASSWGHVSSQNYKKFTETVILNWDMFKTNL